MFSSGKTSLVAVLVSCLALHAHAHAIIAPALGVQGTPDRGDVQRPSAAKPCGNVQVSDINTSTAVPLSAGGTADFTVTDFNAGTDGSRQIASAQVDPTGTGKNFQAATVTKNGDGDPASVGSQPLVVQLPEGIKCAGGEAGNLCLMTFTTTAGFGNCAVVSQGAAAAKGGQTGATGAGKAGGKGRGKAAGSRAARSFLASSGGDTVAKRGLSWIWA